jgi:hypothetical protein
MRSVLPSKSQTCWRVHVGDIIEEKKLFHNRIQKRQREKKVVFSGSKTFSEEDVDAKTTY